MGMAAPIAEDAEFVAEVPAEEAAGPPPPLLPTLTLTGKLPPTKTSLLTSVTP